MCNTNDEIAVSFFNFDDRDDGSLLIWKSSFSSSHTDVARGMISVNGRISFTNSIPPTVLESKRFFNKKALGGAQAT